MPDDTKPTLRSFRSFAAIALLTTLAALGGCNRDAAPERAPEAPPAADSPAAANTPATRIGVRWILQVTGAGLALTLADSAGEPLLRIACVRDPALMTLVAETFEPIGSEERLSFGVDGEPFVFVADPTAERPSGVQAEAPIREELLERFEAASRISAVYGAQQLGPQIPPDRETTATFVASCRQIAGR